MRRAAWIWTLAFAGCFSVPELPEGDPQPPACADCDNADFCDGEERCVDGACVPGAAPCTAGQRCDEANDRCVDGDATVAPDRGPRPDGGPTPDRGVTPDAAAPDGGRLDGGGPDDCCLGVSAGLCQTLHCVDGQCLASTVEDGLRCGPVGVCRAGVCVDQCEVPADCAVPPDACQRPTCVDGVCGAAPCPGDICAPGGCQPCGAGGPCIGNAGCQRTECIDGYCGTFATPEQACDDGDPCLIGDTCDANGVCLAGNTPICDQNQICEAGECLAPAECMNDGQCPDDDRPTCDGGRCVMCRNHEDCMGDISPRCRGGECVCEIDGDCAHLNEEECTFADECASTGSIQRGRCIGRRCEAVREVAACGRPTDGEPCNSFDGICLSDACLPRSATVTVNCVSDLVRVRVTCDDVELIDEACGAPEPSVFECPRQGRMTACCSSDLFNDCAVPPAPGGVRPFNVQLSIQPPLDEVRCDGPEQGTHRECTGLIRQDPTIHCRPR